MQPKEEAASAAVSPLYHRSQEAFYRTLPELLTKHARQWVAFHGEELIGFAATQTDLYQECVRRGLREDEFVVLFADHRVAVL